VSSPENASSQMAQDIKEQAAAWLARSVSEPLSDQDQAEFAAWLAQSTANKLAYWRLDAGWQRSERLAALRPAELPASPKRRSFWPAIFRVAGGIAAAVIVAAVGYDYLQRSDAQTFATQIGGHRLLTLADGSTVELNTDTILRIARTGAGRTVTLAKGEAFFSIKHNSSHPFVVIAGTHRVTDIGTKFSVREYPAKLEVVLVEGKARLETGQGVAPGLLLTPGDVAVATATDLSVTRKAPQQMNAELGWRRGVLVFDNTPLARAAAEFNRYNATKLVIADSATAHISIGGTFRANDAAAFAEVAQGLLRLQVQKRGRDIVISR
jgi:transmembrane sensor